MDAPLCERLDGIVKQGGCRENAALRDLQTDPVHRYARSLCGLREPAYNIGAAERPEAEVDADEEVEVALRPPLRKEGERLLRDNLIELRHQPCLFGHIDKVARLDQPRDRVDDACERLGSDHASGGRVVDGLEVGADASLLDRSDEAALPFDACERLGAELLAEDLDAVAARLFGPVHRGVCVGEQCVGRLEPRLRHRNADAGRYGNLDAERAHRLRDCGPDSVCDGERIAHAGEVFADGEELVAAEPHQRIGGPDDRAHLLRHSDEQPVACGMVDGVVDQLEVVEVDEEHRDGCLRAPRPCERRLQPLLHDRPVGQPGERVVRRLRQQRGLDPPLICHVVDGKDGTCQRP